MKIIEYFDRKLLEFQYLMIKYTIYGLYLIYFCRKLYQSSLKDATKIHVWYQLRLLFESKRNRIGNYLLPPTGIVISCIRIFKLYIEMLLFTIPKWYIDDNIWNIENLKYLPK